jgi:PPK2 family polyphosphate:nucleotide phosphotransferase
VNAEKLAHKVKPGEKVVLADIDADAKGPFKEKADPEVAKRFAKDIASLVDLQERLYGEAKQSLLVILQAMDTAGKDGVLNHVAGPLDSRGVNVVSFKAPAGDETTHDYMWRCHKVTPARGQLTFFNRSYYEEVLVVRVLDLKPKAVWKKRFDHMTAFERMLTDEGTKIVKIYLHISRDEQKRRLEERLATPEKRWKFDMSDLKAREHWDDYREAYQEAISRTAADHAPWWIVPANRKWYRDIAVARILVEALEEMNPQYPTVNLPEKITIPD